MSNKPNSKARARTSLPAPAASKPAASGVSGKVIGIGIGAVIAILAVIAIIATAGGDDGASDLPQTQPITVVGEPLPMLTDGADPAIGTAAPTLSGLSFDGTAVTVEPGTPTLLVFLAHWCPVCQAEVPQLVDWYESGEAPEGVEVIGVATATTDSRPNFPPSEWLEGEAWPWPVMADDADYTAATAMGLDGFPYFVLLNADGTVALRSSGAQDMSTLSALITAALD